MSTQCIQNLAHDGFKNVYLFQTTQPKNSAVENDMIVAMKIIADLTNLDLKTILILLSPYKKVNLMSQIYYEMND